MDREYNWPSRSRHTTKTAPSDCADDSTSPYRVNPNCNDTSISALAAPDKRTSRRTYGATFVTPALDLLDILDLHTGSHDGLIREPYTSPSTIQVKKTVPSFRTVTLPGCTRRVFEKFSTNWVGAGTPGQVLP